MIYLLTGIYCIRQAPFHPVILLRFVHAVQRDGEKQMNGSMKSIHSGRSHTPQTTLPSGGISAPPTIAITSPAAPALNVTQPFQQSRMVGNISDMKMEWLPGSESNGSPDGTPGWSTSPLWQRGSASWTVSGISSGRLMQRLDRNSTMR